MFLTNSVLKTCPDLSQKEKEDFSVLDVALYGQLFDLKNKIWISEYVTILGHSLLKLSILSQWK